MMNAGVELKALRRSRGSWVLVVEELVRVDADYYKPRRSWVRGQEAILDTLAERGNRDLLESARRAMASSHPSYKIRGSRLERWHPDDENRSPSANGNSGRPSGISSKEFGRLRARCESLEARVEALEATLKRVAQASHRASTRHAHPSESREAPNGVSPSMAPKAASSSGVGAPAVSGGAAVAEPVDPAVSAASAEAAKAEAAEPAAASPTPDASADAAAEASGAEASEEASGEVTPPPPETDPELMFPDAAAYGKALASLLGEEIPLDDEEGPFPVKKEPYYFTELIDDEDKVLGAILVDLKAVIYQGGTLMMLGENALKSMLKDQDPSEDVIEAMKEIVNVQSRCFNDIKGNPHLRIREFRQVESGDDDWLMGSAHRAGLVDGFGGCTILLSK